jgi:hypothetical protein
MYNFPGWSPTVDHDGRVVVKCTNKVFTNMVPGENDANYKHYPTFFGAYNPKLWPRISQQIMLHNLVGRSRCRS